MYSFYNLAPTCFSILKTSSIIQAFTLWWYSQGR